MNLASTFVPNGRTVEAGRGWSWIVEGFELFRRQPGPWIALILVAALIFIGLSLIPLLGALAGLVLAPVFAAGFVIACRDQERGEGVEVSHLFAGFRDRFQTLASIGLIYLGITVLIALVVGLGTGAGLWTLLGSGRRPDGGGRRRRHGPARVPRHAGAAPAGVHGAVVLLGARRVP